MADIDMRGTVTLSGDGSINLGGNQLEGGSATLTLAGGTVSGPGAVLTAQMTIGAAGVIQNDGAVVLELGVYTSPSIVNAGTIASTGAGGMLIKDAVVNTGTLSVAGGGTFEVDGAVTGAGVAIVGGGTLEFLSTVDDAVIFTGAGTLDFTQSREFDDTVTGFSTTGDTTLDLRDIRFVGAGEATFSGTASSGVLTVSDGKHTASITLDGDFLNATFVASDDGAGGTDVIAQTSQRPAGSVHALVSAMAGFAAPSAVTIRTDQAQPIGVWLLSSPRAVIA
jgi:hypothetical protein